MTEPQSLPFVMNQAQIDAAILQELPRLLKNLTLGYTNGRQPKGLSAAVNIDETSIRAAVLAHARRLVNPMFTHFSVDFVATRGEDGITANIIASNVEITPDVIAEKGPTTKASDLPDPAIESASAPAAVEPEPDTATEGTATDAPFEGGVTNDSPSELEAAPAPAEVTAAPAPAAGRSRLFADLKRPSNEPAEG